MNKNILLKQLSAAEFAMWEIHLYLDTHPGDVHAVTLYNKYRERYEMLKAEFESNYYILSSEDAQGVQWLKNPWPWEKDGCCC